MKNTYIVLAVLIGILIAWVSYRRGVNSVGIISHSDTLKVYSDTGKHIVSVDKPFPVFKDTGSIEYVIVPMDTAEIFAAYANLHHLYYTRNIYYDTLKNDSAAFIALWDTVFKNELEGRSLVYQNRTPTYYITKTIQQPERNQWFVGGDITNIRGNIGLDVSVEFINRGVAYRYAYNPLVGEHSLGLYVRLWPRSRSPAE